ncbi:response regulator transcription factor [Cellulosimicrobium cellulans]|uniref:response regulator transcription factor n=1 Tax=Cellulosimicrobium cellulans TaxID=1710 RepID=UPI00130E876E|nr:response regulator transcription factor [Cellulosimicrobium cellulans]
MSGIVRVLVADDQVMIRLGLRMILDNEPDIETVGEASDGAQALDLARRLQPDVILMDVRMPEHDGIEATRQVRADPALNAVRVLILTTFDEEQYVTDALQIGADGFLLKDTDPATLVSAVHRIHSGGHVLDPAVTGFVLKQWRAGTSTRPGGARQFSEVTGLSPRERDVLLAVARGESNQQAAESLGLTLATVKTYVHELLSKTGCTSRTQLVVLAYEAGLIVPGSEASGDPTSS